MSKIYQSLLFRLFLLGLSFPACAAPWDVKFFNPKATDEDVILPMPCEGFMAFRKIHVPKAKPLDDLGITLGSETGDLRYLEQAHPAYIAGSFTTTQPAPGRFYLLAKYETTELQYQAVMADTCPKPAMKLMTPQVAVSWFDAMQFSDRYNVWLRKNAMDALPKEDKSPGFVRLPTEIEWEYAARGGNAVSSTDFRGALFPMPDGLNKYVWFAGSQSANGKLQNAGLLQPNALGLHDILGNADEMMFESFRLNKLDRFHGQAGGFIVRGGNYMTAEDEMRTSWRQEQTYYRGAEPNRLKTSGIRLALVSPSLTSMERGKEIAASWEKLGTVENAPVTPSANSTNTTPAPSTVERLGSLLSGLTDDKLKKELEAVRTELRASNQTRDEQRSLAIRSALQQGAFMCVLLNREGRFFDALKRNYDQDCSKPEALDKGDQESCTRRKGVLDGRKSALDLAVSLYSDSIVEAGAIYTTEMVAPEVTVKQQQLLARKTSNLGTYVTTYWSHLGGYLKDRKISQADWMNGCKAVPVN